MMFIEVSDQLLKWTMDSLPSVENLESESGRIGNPLKTEDEFYCQFWVVVQEETPEHALVILTGELNLSEEYMTALGERDVWICLG